MDKSKYEVIPIGITQKGKWLVSGNAKALLPEAIMSSNHHRPVAIIGDPTRQGLTRLGNDSEVGQIEPLDVVFPVLHGTYGEDGTIQGLLEMAGVPYVGCGVLASSTGMDKVVMKQLFERAGLEVTRYEWFLRSAVGGRPRRRDQSDHPLDRFPVFVKPANLGSSVGISKAENRRELREAIADAARYDRRVIVEQGVSTGERSRSAYSATITRSRAFPERS